MWASAKLVADGEEPNERRAETRELVVLLDGVAQHRVRRQECAPQLLGGLLGGAGRLLIELREVAGNEGRCDVAASVPAHAVGDEEQVIPGVPGIRCSREPCRRVTRRHSRTRMTRLGPQLERGFADCDRGEQRDRGRLPHFLAVEQGAVR